MRRAPQVGIANLHMAEIEEKFNDGPCVRVPTLKRAWEEASSYLETLDDVMRRDLMNYRRRLHPETNSTH